MHIVICVKQVLDPEVAPEAFRIDPTTRRPVQGSAKLVMDSYAEYALEVALQLQERYPDTRVTALSVGDRSHDEALRRALALGAGAMARAWDEAWHTRELDAPAVAHILGRAIARLGGADLVLTGRQGSDIEHGVVGPMLAEELGAQCVTLVTGVEVADCELRLRREMPDGHAIFATRTPAVLTITNAEDNVPRLPKVKDLLLAARKPVPVLSAAELGLDPDRLAPGVVLRDLLVPPPPSGQCELITGADGARQAEALAARLADLRLI